MLAYAIETVAGIVDVFGIGIIFWGVGVGLAGLVSIPLRRDEGTNVFQALARVRCKVGAYMLLGLEVLIASDIAETVIDPSYERIALLGAIVAIRTALSFFLSRELEAVAAQT